MKMVDEIKDLNMFVDKKYNDPYLIEALDLYHYMVKNNIIKPRENQLNKFKSLKEIDKLQEIKL